MMGKRLNTTVHLFDVDTGENVILTPDSKLSGAQRKELEKRWGKRSSEFFEDSEDAAPEEVSQEEHQAAGHPPADSTSADDTSEQVEDAMKIREETRTDAGKAATEAHEAREAAREDREARSSARRTGR